MTWTIVVGLVVYAAIWLTVGFLVGVRRHRDPVDRWDAATAMRNAATPPPPPELAPERFTAEAHRQSQLVADSPHADEDQNFVDATLALPDLNNDTIAIGAPDSPLALEATSEPAEPLDLTPTTTTSVAPWRPPSYDPGSAAADVSTWRPEPSVILTVAWKRPDAPLIAGRYDITQNEPLPDEVAPLYKAMRHQQEHFGGDITVAVKIDGRARDDWEWTANDEWPRQSIDAIRQARDQLQGTPA